MLMMKDMTPEQRQAVWEDAQRQSKAILAGRTSDDLFNTPWPVRQVSVDGPDTNPHHASYQTQSRFTGPDYRQIKAQEEDRYPGKITRIDLFNTQYGPAKKCWRAGWMPGDKPRLSDAGPLTEGWDIETAAARLEAEGWVVRRWPGGARAWRIKPRPVRTGNYADKFRDRMLANPPKELEGAIGSFDKFLDL